MSHLQPFLHTKTPHLYRGKTRDTYTLSGYPDHLLVVASDRLSTHNIVHESLIPKKGEILTALTIFWLTGVVARLHIAHQLEACGRDIYDYLPGNPGEYPKDLHKRAIVVRRLKMLPYEFIYRGYHAGSLYRDYSSKGLQNPYGVLVEPEFPLMAKFGRIVFTPTEKSENDEPVSASQVVHSHTRAYSAGKSVFGAIRTHLNGCGLEVVDSKFEFGTDWLGNCILADEVGTPDSSRFCDLSAIKEGIEPPWLDKQIARDAAVRIWSSGPKHPISFDAGVIEEIVRTYEGIFQRITGMSLADFQRAHFS